MITRVQLLTKKAELEEAYKNATAQMNAFGGALQFCEHLIEILDQEAEDPKEQNDHKPRAE